MGILSLNIVQDERKTMRTLSYRMDFKHWLPTLYPRARIDLTNWLLTSFGGKDLQEPQARLWRAHFTSHGSIDNRIYDGTLGNFCRSAQSRLPALRGFRGVLNRHS
jgi:hypothetical protein